MTTEETLGINGEITNRRYLAQPTDQTLTQDTTYEVIDSKSGLLKINSADDLAYFSKKTYLNTGTSKETTLELKLYLIDDYGNIMTSPENLGDWVSLMLNTNVELQVNSSDFKYGDIDVVSKILWWSALNPKK